MQAAVSALKYFIGLPELPGGYFISSTRDANMLDFLQYTFGFQVCIQDFPVVFLIVRIYFVLELSFLYLWYAMANLVYFCVSWLVLELTGYLFLQFFC